MTFSIAVMSPNSRMFWKVRAMPRRVIWNGRRLRVYGNPSGRYSSNSSPRNRMLPAEGM
jgi:hypothetical protein